MSRNNSKREHAQEIERAGGIEAFRAKRREYDAKRRRSLREKAAAERPLGTGPTVLINADRAPIESALTLEEYRQLDIKHPISWAPGRKGGNPLSQFITAMGERVGQDNSTCSVPGINIKEMA